MNLWQDLRYSLRLLLKRPGFTVVAVVTLALGIGANTSIFSVVDSILLRPLPFKEPDRLVTLWETNAQQSKGKDARDAQVASTANFLDWKSQNPVFEGMAAYITWTYNLTGVDDPERVEASVVTGSFFDVLGAQASLGRVIVPADDQPGSDSVVLLSHGFWARRFGSDPSIIGKPITLNGHSFTVIGVLPPTFKFPDPKVELWVPFGFAPAQQQNREGKFLSVVARLKSGVELKQARAAMSTIASQLERQYPATNTGWGIGVAPLQANEARNIRPTLLILFGAVGFVLLLACANVSSLLLAGAAARRKEMAIRAALGASRRRLISQLLTESALLGGVFGLLLAVWGIDLLASLVPGDIPHISEVGIDGRVFGFTLLLSVLTSFVFGLAPALSSTRSDLQDALKESSLSATGGTARRLHALLVVFEIAVSLVLLIGAGLLVKSFLRLQDVDPGFNAKNKLTLRIWLPASRYATNEQQTAFFQQVIDRVAAIPTVQSASAIQDLPLKGNKMSFKFTMEGRAPAPAGAEPEAAYRVITPDYFRTMEIPLLRGRAITAGDDRTATPVVVINQSMAQQFWPGEDPIGRRIRFGDESAPWYTIVGVVGDVKHMGLDAQEGAAFYQPHAQKRFDFLRWMTVVVRTESDPTDVIAAVRSQVRAVDKDQPVYEIATMEQLLSESVAKPRFSMLLLGSFALLALVLAGIGIYGVISYSVAQRTHEIGVRMALGAQPGNVLKMVLGQGVKLILLGLVIGVAGAFALTRLMSSLLYGVSAVDPVTFILVSALLAAVALLACYIPARRSMRVDPMEALRYE